MSSRKKIGLFGGTFDPIHQGHLIAAESVRESFRLDQVIFIPANLQPFKSNQAMQPAEHRLEMVQLAIAGNSFFQVSDIEIKGAGISYTIDTLVKLRKIYPEQEFDLFFLLGSDNLQQFHTWRSPEKLVQLCSFIAFGRPGSHRKKQHPEFADAFHYFDMPLIDISSTDIRRRLKESKSVRYFSAASGGGLYYRE